MIERPKDKNNNEQKNPILVALGALMALLLRGIAHIRHLIETEGLFFFIAFVSTLVIGLAVMVFGGAMVSILADIG